MPGKVRHQPVDVERPRDVRIDASTPLKADTPASKDPEEPVCIWSQPVEWVGRLSRNYSWRLLAMVACTNHLLKGFVAGGGQQGLVGKPIEFLLADMSVNGARIQVLKAAALAPWAMKPVVALMSDALPLFGYRKMPYVVLSTLFAAVGALIVGFGFATSTGILILCLFMMFLQVSCVDLLVEARQSEEVKRKSSLGPELMTFSWLGINVFQIASVLLLGPIIQNFGPSIPYIIALPLILVVLWPTLANFLGEKATSPEDQSPNFRLLRRHPVLCALTLLVGFMMLALTVCTFWLGSHHLACLSLSFAFVVPITFFLFIRSEIAGPVVFYYVLQMLSFNADGALFYFYTDPPSSFPNGPHFTPYFYTTGLGVAGFTGVFIGFLTGAELFKDWTYRRILQVMIVLRVFTQLLLVPALMRWTFASGIPDKLWITFVLGIDSMVVAWRWIPKQVMGAHLTPHGMEATMLGLTAGTFNMALILSSYFGGFLLDAIGVLPVGGRQDAAMFDHIWKVQVLAAFAPCLMLFTLPSLMPDKSQKEALLVERPDSATYGSPFERYMSTFSSER